jgi:hypothetical protein
VDLRKGTFNEPEASGWFVDQDFIPRNSTGSAVVVQGVKVGENPELTTMWTVLGYPPVSVAYPVWVKGAETLLPQLISSAPGEKNTPLGKKVDALKTRVFSYHQGNGTNKYLHWEELYNKKGNGIMQQLAPVEDEVFCRTQPVIDSWRKKGRLDIQQLKALYQTLSGYISESYNSIFNL